MSLCGASKGEKALTADQRNFFHEVMGQAKTVFGDSSAVFGDLMKTFEPIVAAGPNQQGFTNQELAARNSSVISNVGQQYKNASQAVRAGIDAQGGGNMALPSGAAAGAEMGIAERGAESTAEGLNKVTEENYATGRQNYEFAAQGLQNAPNVFNVANEANKGVTEAGDAAMKSQQSIDAQSNAWKGAVGGILGAGLSAATGGMSGVGGKLLGGLGKGLSGEADIMGGLGT